MKPGLILLLIACVLPGCIAPAPPLPTVEWDTLEDARQILIDRQDAIESVQAQLKLKITTPPPQSETNTLDAALVMQGDDRFRLRAWKLNQTIIDLTVTPDGTFIVANEEMKKKAPQAEQDLAKLTDQLGALLSGPNYREAELRLSNPGFGSDVPSPESTISASWDNGFGEINRQSLTPERFAFYKPDAGLPDIGFQTAYSVYESLYWYRRVVVIGDFGEIEMIFRDVELNGELNPRAFRPPRRAVRVEELTASSQGENASP